MQEIKVTVTFEKEIKDLLCALLGANNVSIANSGDSGIAKGIVEQMGGLNDGVGGGIDKDYVEQASGVKDGSDGGMAGGDITIDDIRKIATKLIGSNKKEELKAVLGSFGVTRITNIKKEHYNAVHGKLLRLQESI